MLYYIYIGNNKTAINHPNTITDGMFTSVFSIDKAAKVINGIRERYNTSILYEQTNTEKDCIDVSYLHKKLPYVYIILITGKLQTEHRKAYLQAGVDNTLPLQVDKESIQGMGQFLQIRQQRKIRGFNETRRKASNTSHLSLWKRTFDVLFPLSALVILSPLLTGTAITIRLESKGKVVYKSQRVGGNYRIFNFLKFRSMYTNADKRLKKFNALNQYQTEEEVVKGIPDIHFDDLTGPPEEEVTLLILDDFVVPGKDFLKQKAHTHESPFVKIGDDPRVTRIGRFIRKYSIDGLPQLLNVLEGDMSTVGSCPLSLYEAELLTSDVYIDHFMALSGPTGLWQVKKRGGAGRMSAEERE